MTMFRIFAVALTVAFTAAFPPIIVVTGPALVLAALVVRERRAEARRQLRVYEDWKAEQERTKIFKSW